MYEYTPQNSLLQKLQIRMCYKQLKEHLVANAVTIE